MKNDANFFFCVLKFIDQIWSRQKTPNMKSYLFLKINDQNFSFFEKLKFEEKSNQKKIYAIKVFFAKLVRKKSKKSG